MIYGIENNVSAIWDRFLQIFQYIVIIISWSNFAFRQKKLKSIISDFRRICEITESLGIQSDNFKTIGIIVNYTLLINFLYFFLFAIQLNLNIIFPTDREKVFSNLSSLFRLIYHNTFFLFVSALRIVCQQFRQLNTKIEFFKLTKKLQEAPLR